MSVSGPKRRWEGRAREATPERVVLLLGVAFERVNAFRFNYRLISVRAHTHTRARTHFRQLTFPIIHLRCSLRVVIHIIFLIIIYFGWCWFFGWFFFLDFSGFWRFLRFNFSGWRRIYWQIAKCTYNGKNKKFDAGIFGIARRTAITRVLTTTLEQRDWASLCAKKKHWPLGNYIHTYKHTQIHTCEGGTQPGQRSRTDRESLAHTFFSPPEKPNTPKRGWPGQKNPRFPCLRFPDREKIYHFPSFPSPSVRGTHQRAHRKKISRANGE